MSVMFVLLINPHSFNKLLLCYLFSFYLRVWNSPTQRTPHHLLYYIFQNFLYLPREFATGICCRNLECLFAARVCREFSCIYKQIFFCIWEQILFLGKQTFSISKPYLSVPICYCRGSYGSSYWRHVLANCDFVENLPGLFY